MNKEQTLHGDSVETKILNYLNEHPYAVDTFDGIFQWWLPLTSPSPLPSFVEEVLEGLVKKGKIEKFISQEGVVLYRRSHYSL